MDDCVKVICDYLRWLRSYISSNVEEVIVKHDTLTLTAEDEDETEIVSEGQDDEVHEIMSTTLSMLSISQIAFEAITNFFYTNEFLKYNEEFASPEHKIEFKDKNEVFKKMEVEGDFSDDPKNPTLIGKGGFAKVFKGRCRDPDYPKEPLKKAAIKVINYKSNLKNVFPAIRNELYALEKLSKHKNIIKMYCHFIIDLRQLYIAMELADTNLDKLVKDSSTGLKKDVARYYFGQMLDGLKFMHSQRLAHRDLKTKNVLLVKSSDTGPYKYTAKLADFGLSVVAWSKRKGPQLVNKRDGTKHYMAPEIVRICATKPKDLDKREHYDAFQADIWAMGVNLYVMLTNEKPYEYHKYLRKIKNLKDKPKKQKKAERKMYSKMLVKIENEDFVKELPPEMRLDNNPFLYDFLRRMMHVDADWRLTADECLHHPWMTDDDYSV